MKFEFKYEPVKFRQYVREHFANVDFLPYPNYDHQQFISQLARLRGQVDVQVKESNEHFQNWLNQLSLEYKKLLPFVYSDFQNDAQKGYAIFEMQKIVMQERIVFAHLLHQCYSTNQFTPYWFLLTKAYKANREKYNRNWPTHVKDVWSRYIQIDKRHANYVAMQILKMTATVEEVMNDYFIRPEHAFYREVLIWAFEKGSLPLFEREVERFKDLFESADIEIAQKLATGFIRANAMRVLEKEAQLIYKHLGTYVKRPENWTNTTEEVKKAFHSWYLSQNLKEFFGDVNENHERFIYWEKFVSKMNDIIVLQDQQTILFYFDDVIIMEILGTGAVYVYEHSVFERHYGNKIAKYKRMLESATYQQYGHITYRLTREMIRNQDLIYKEGRLLHKRGWQKKFDHYLSNKLGWEV